MTNKGYNHELEIKNYKKQYGGDVAKLANEIFNMLNSFDTRPADDADYASEFEEAYILEGAVDIAKSKYWNENNVDTKNDYYERSFVINSGVGAIGALMYHQCIKPVMNKLIDEYLKIFKKYDDNTVCIYLD